MTSVAYLVGSFDLLHVGHLDVIAQALERSQRLVVGVVDDELVTRSTGRPPVVPLDERLALVGHVRGVSEAVVHAVDRPRELGADHVLVVAGDDVAAPAEAEKLSFRRQTSSATLLAALVRTQDREVA